MSARCVIALVWLAFAAISCSHSAPPPVAKKPDVKHGLCWEPRDPRTFAAPVRAHDWVSLLLRLELGHGGVFARRDCLGRTIPVEPIASCSAAGPEGTPSSEPIAEESVLVRDLGGDRHLIWIITHRFDSGEGYGPLALVHHARDALELEALGTLRMRTERVKLEYWAIKDDRVIVASGETCEETRGKEPGCKRSVSLRVQRGMSLVDLPLSDPDGRCLQPASFELAQKQERTLPSGLVRRFELSANVTHDARYVVIEERLLVRDTDPSAPLQPAREVQRIETNRFIQAASGRLVTRQHSLWSRAVDSTPASPTAAHSSRR
jgi:hypothetical protein